ncbi:uncharacterized protein LOC119566266 [Chelonia mydas]|uniref:uncharacterized protein LOC119566266 n=1 Tax=Chelonia mydas TaxID=8469 RepID=UPI001CA87CAD|nr:uncharacterized protein LOC119566266 [Chelonia mydas]
MQIKDCVNCRERLELTEREKEKQEEEEPDLQRTASASPPTVQDVRSNMDPRGQASLPGTVPQEHWQPPPPIPVSRVNETASNEAAEIMEGLNMFKRICQSQEIPEDAILKMSAEVLSAITDPQSRVNETASNEAAEIMEGLNMFKRICQSQEISEDEILMSAEVLCAITDPQNAAEDLLAGASQQPEIQGLLHIQELLQNFNEGDRGEPRQLIQLEKGKMMMNEGTLQFCLEQPHLRDVPVCVISILGEERKGKSFLLNYLLRRLQNLNTQGDSWMGRDDDVLQGFTWRAGTAKTTEGLWIWSKPFIIERYGNKVAVFLVDSEGSLNMKENKESMVKMSTISMILSNYLIYNTQNKMNTADWSTWRRSFGAHRAASRDPAPTDHRGRTAGRCHPQLEKPWAAVRLVGADTLEPQQKRRQQNFNEGDRGEPRQLIQLEKGKMLVNEGTLQFCLEQPHLRDVPVCVISILGEERKGKSFLLNYLLRRLQNLVRPPNSG